MFDRGGSRGDRWRALRAGLIGPPFGGAKDGAPEGFSVGWAPAKQFDALVLRAIISLMKFRHSAGFGKRIEYWIVAEMLKEGLDVYVPLVDDMAIDAIVRRKDGSFVEVQIKARSKTCNLGDGALFAGIFHELRPNYWFIFYSERLDMKWIMTSEEFLGASSQNKKGKNAGLRSIWLNGGKKNKVTGVWEEHPLPRFEPFLAKDYSRLNEPPQVSSAHA